jgi:hypothetical protein
MQLPRPPSLLLLIPLALAVLGCSKPRFSYDIAPAFRTGSYRTVAQDPRRDRIVIREGLRPLNPELHLRAVLAELAARNYRLSPNAEADLWVAVYVLLGGSPEGAGDGAAHARHEGSGEGRRGGARGGAGTGGAPAARGKFTLIVQLEDRQTGLPIWQGEANLDHTDKAPDGTPLSIEAAVHQLLQPLPMRP